MKLYVRIAGSLVLLGLLAWKVDFAEIGTALSHVAWGWWLAALGVYFVAQVVSSVRWQALARPVGFNISLARCTAFCFIGNFFNMLLPTSVGGDVARALYLDAGGGRRWLAFLTVLADRLNGLFVLVAMACVAAVIVPLPGWIVAWTMAAGIAALFGLGVLLWLGRNRVQLSSDHCSGGRLKRLLGELSEVSRLYGRSPRLIAAVSFVSLIVQVANVFLVWLLALALDIKVPLEYCFVLMPLVTLLTLAPISVGGMGVREGGAVLLLAPIGVAAEQAVTLSLLWFSVFTMAGLAGAGSCLFGRFSRSEVPSHAVPVGGDSDQGRAGQSRAAA